MTKTCSACGFRGHDERHCPMPSIRADATDLAPHLFDQRKGSPYCAVCGGSRAGAQHVQPGARRP